MSISVGKRVLALSCALLAFLPAGCEMRRRPVAAPAARPALSIHDAVRANDLAELKRLVDSGSDVNQPDPDGVTPLHIAAFHGLEVVADYLTAAGADVNARDARGRTPLHLAAAGGHALVVRRLFAADADPNLADEEGNTAILLAQHGRHAEVFDLLLAAGAAFDFTPEIGELEAPPSPEPVAAPAPEPARAPGNFRTWTSASSAQVEAEFVEILLDTVVLRSPHNQIFHIPINRLQREDQILARELAAAARPTAVSRARAVPEKPEPSSISSVALRIGQQGGWTVLENCRLKSSGANDGDSFHILHQGKEYIFRLYYVDAAETSLTFPQRVQEQARYFDLDTRETLQLGENAAHYTHKQLAGQPFTIATRWEDAQGSSRLKRYFAFVTTDRGDLDELLVSQGLARVYGMPIEGSLGAQKRYNLKKLEHQAKRAGLGAWTRHKAVEIVEKP